MLSIEEDGSMVMKSTPILRIPGGSKFVTRTEIEARDITKDSGAQCMVLAQATCEAAGPWGMIGTIEGIMAEQAAKAIQKFLRYCSSRAADKAVALSQQV